MKTYKRLFLRCKRINNSVHRVQIISISIVVSLAFLLFAGCRHKNAVSVNRKDPESVLRAYFDAWNRNDWSFRASLMDERYGHITPEPVEYVRIVELRYLPDPSSPDRTYQVTFEIKVTRPGSMNSGQYHWTYILSWDASRGSWLITNYGAG